MVESASQPSANTDSMKKSSHAQLAAARFDDWAETYGEDRISAWFSHYQSRSIASMGLTGEMSFLDVGCGVGKAVVEAARSRANCQKMMLSDSSRCVERNQLTSRLTSDVERNTRYSDLLFCGVVRSNVMPTNISGSCHLEPGSKPSLLLGSKNSTRSVRPVSL